MSSDIQPKAPPGTLWKAPKAVKKPKNRGIKVKFPIDPIWVKVREDWFELNQPDLGEEFYQCALCPYPVHRSEATLDHIITRSRRPDLRYDFANLQPAHWKCNSARGSMSMEAWNEKRYIKKSGKTVDLTGG